RRLPAACPRRGPPPGPARPEGGTSPPGGCATRAALRGGRPVGDGAGGPQRRRRRGRLPEPAGTGPGCHRCRARRRVLDLGATSYAATPTTAGAGPMTALPATSLVLTAVGSAWCLDGLPWFRDRPVAQRMRPYVGRGTPASGRPTGLSGVRQVLAPIAIRLSAPVGTRTSTRSGSANCRTRPYRRSEEHTSELQSRENLGCGL